MQSNFFNENICNFEESEKKTDVVNDHETDVTVESGINNITKEQTKKNRVIKSGNDCFVTCFKKKCSFN